MKEISHHFFIVLRQLMLIATILAGITLAVPAGIGLAEDAVYALEFDGSSDMVRLAQTEAIFGGTGWRTTKSVNVWIKPEAGNICTFPTAPTCPPIFVDDPHFWGITIGLITSGVDAGKNRIWVWNSDGDLDTIGIEYNPGEWVNIALVHEGGTLRAYKNGLLRGSITSGATDQPDPTKPRLFLGGMVGSDILLLQGQIDEVRLWDWALTASDINANMYQSLVGNETGLVAYYKMSDGTGTTLTDDSVNSWNGELLDGLLPTLPPDTTYPLWVTSDAFIVPDPPAAPTNLDASVISAYQIDLSWTDNSTNESDFEIDRCTGVGCSDFSFLTSVSPNTATHADTSVAPNTTYCYRVRATNAGGTSAYTNVDCATTPNAPPAAPTGLIATESSPTRIDLAWIDNSTNETSFEVERCTGSGCGNFSLLASVSADSETYPDTSAAPNTTYCYKVRATNLVGPSVYSDVDCATTPDVPPPAPTGLTATETSPTQIDLAWNDNSTNEANFEIERCTGLACSNFSPLASVAVNSETYPDTSVTVNTTYCYKVRAINASGPSDYTNVDCARIPDISPAAPTNLTATESSPTRIDLAWNDNATNEAGFEIERCTGFACSNFSLLTTVSADSEAYPDTSATRNTTYCYRVRATNLVGPSGYTNVDCATTPDASPAAPTGLTATDITATRVDLTWKDNSDNELSFEIERCTGSGCSNFSLLTSVSANSETYSDHRAAPSTTYCYRVRATNTIGPSNYTNIACATTPIQHIYMPAFRK